MAEIPTLKPLGRFDHQSVNKLVVDLNNVLRRMAVNLPKGVATKNDLDSYVRSDDLPGAIQSYIDDALANQTSDEQAGGSSSINETSSGENDGGEEAAQAALAAAVPSVAPPFIATTSVLGTATSPPKFALADHTHGGSLDFRQVFMAPKRDYTLKQPVQGTYGDSTHVPAISVDRVGRVTSVSSVLITPSAADLALRHSLGLTPKGDKTAKQPVQGTYGSSTQSAVVTVDRVGRVTAVTTAVITPTTTDLAFRRVLGF